MSRVSRLLLVVPGLVAALAVASPAAAVAPPRPLLVGFEDEPTFLWSRDRFRMLGKAGAAHATLIRVIVEWHLIARKRPADPRNPGDRAYHFEGLDDLVWHSQLRGMRVLLTVWGTPAWASRSHKVNAAPSPADLGDFCYALGKRYSGTFRGQPFVGLYSVWNEPNLNTFLTPQFDARGRSRSPQLYAAMFRACAGAINAANPPARVGIGETSPRGKDSPRSVDFQPSHSPGRFAEALARIRPRLSFDAWAHHPYPPGFRGPPTDSLGWPNVGVGDLRVFEQRLRRLFGRRSVPLWLTEFAYQTRPERQGALTYAQQARYLVRAFQASVAVPEVAMFVWYVFRDTRGQLWQSGLLRRNSSVKPAYAAFARLAARYDVRNPTLVIRPRPSPVVQLSVVDFKADRLPGDPPIGMTYRVYETRTEEQVTSGQARAVPDVYGTIRVAMRFNPRPATEYTVTFDLNDIHGHTAVRRAKLIVTSSRR